MFLVLIPTISITVLNEFGSFAHSDETHTTKFYSITFGHEALTHIKICLMSKFADSPN